MDFSHLPKAELHLHLDCSMSFEVARKSNPDLSLDEYRKYFVAPAKCTDLADYITRAVRAIELMQTPEQLRWVTLDLFDQLKKDHVVYAEIRFAPLLHLEQGLKPREVVEAVNEAVQEGIKETGVEVGILLCTLRHYSEVQSMETVRLVNDFKGTHVLGFDIAADEAGFPVTNHIRAFEFANQNGIACTAHAGEARGADSVWETLRLLRPSRIGHGVRSMEDENLVAHLIKDGIHLEVCPTSNVQTNVYEKISDHAVDRIFKAGVSMSINTDGRTVSDVRLEDEYRTLAKWFAWKKEHFLKCNLEAIEHSFTSREKKEVLKRKILEGFASHE